MIRTGESTKPFAVGGSRMASQPHTSAADAQTASSKSVQPKDSARRRTFSVYRCHSKRAQDSIGGSSGKLGTLRARNQIEDGRDPMSGNEPPTPSPFQCSPTGAPRWPASARSRTTSRHDVQVEQQPFHRYFLCK